MISKLFDLTHFIQGYLQGKRGSRLTALQIQALQKRKFENLCKRVLYRSNFYRSYVGKTLNDYPVINKSLHMENFDCINTQGLIRDRALDVAIQSEQSRDFQPEYKGFSVGLSSGTSGNRGLFALSSRERAHWAGYIIAKMLPFQLKKHRVAFFLRANNNLYETSSGVFLTFRFFDLIAGIEAHIDSLDNYAPSILIAPGSVLRRIAESRTCISPRRVIAVAEVLENEDREIIESRFGVKVEQIYQCTEGFLAATCTHGSLHLNEDAYIIEKHWVDKPSGRFSPIVTDLNRSTQPVVRYLLDDVLIESPEPCPCGSAMTRIQSIEGRCDDVLRLKKQGGGSVEVFSDYVRNSIIAGAKDIAHYRVTQTGENNLLVEVAPFTSQLTASVANALNELWLRLSVISPEYEFREYLAADYSKKQRRVIRVWDG